MTSWVKPDDALIVELWPDAPADPEVVQTLLNSAHVECVAYAPVLPVDAAVPDNYRIAEVMQARAQHRSFVAGSGDTMGGELTVTSFPLDWTVRQLLRPRHIGRVT